MAWNISTRKSGNSNKGSKSTKSDSKKSTKSGKSGKIYGNGCTDTINHGVLYGPRGKK
jgi:hypothetical protein